MRALVFDEFGPADVLHIADVEAPEPAAGQVRVAVQAAGVNPVDWKIRSGASRAFHSVSFPAIPGMDAAGTVDAVGAGVTAFSVGDAVFGSTVGGATAEFALMENPTAKPDGMDWAVAAGLPSAVETAHRALRYLDLDLGVGAGRTLLVNGVAGGVGLAVAQLATARGARVVGTASAARHEFLSTIGVEAVTYGPGLEDRLASVTDRIDLVVDVAGNGILPELLELVSGNTARIVTVADPAAADAGVFFTTGSEGRFWESLSVAADLWSEGRFVMPVDHVYPLSQGAEAHRASETGHVLGKIVISTAD
jgi:NADPH:quinone reductase-like Zn-dependent oxidoreductase